MCIRTGKRILSISHVLPILPRHSIAMLSSRHMYKCGNRLCDSRCLIPQTWVVYTKDAEAMCLTPLAPLDRTTCGRCCTEYPQDLKRAVIEPFA